MNLFYLPNRSLIKSKANGSTTSVRERTPAHVLQKQKVSDSGNSCASAWHQPRRDIHGVICVREYSGSNKHGPLLSLGLLSAAGGLGVHTTGASVRLTARCYLDMMISWWTMFLLQTATSTSSDCRGHVCGYLQIRSTWSTSVQYLSSWN